MIRILLADDHEVVRRGLKAILLEHSGWEVCGKAVSGREAVDLARQLQPDIAIIDLMMPDLNGLEATRQIRKASGRTQVLSFTMHYNESIVHDVLDTGARGYSFSHARLLIWVDHTRLHPGEPPHNFDKFSMRNAGWIAEIGDGMFVGQPA